MSNNIDQDVLRRALQAQFGTVVCYRTVISTDNTEEVLSGDCDTLTGHPASAFSGSGGRRIEQLVFPGDAARVRRERELQLKKTGEYSVQYRLVRPDGGTSWVRDVGTQNTGATGSVVREGVLADITAQRDMNQRAGRLELELENSRALLNGISDGTDTHLMVLEGDATIFLVNRSWTN